MDAQSAAYRAAPARAWNTDDVLTAAVVHEPGTPPDKSPEEWDAAGWDHDRDGPKTMKDAQAALAARISDPTAPDDHNVAGAYDGEGE